MNDLVILQGYKIENIRTLKTKYADGGFVYALDTPNGIKIGRTIQPYKRIKSIMTQANVCIFQFIVTKECKNYGAIEIELHKRFGRNRKLGEWFNIVFYDVLKEIKTKNLIDPSVTFEESNIRFEKFSKKLITPYNTYQPNNCNFDLESWNPKKTEIEFIKEDIMHYIESLREDCGEYEEAQKMEKTLKCINTSNGKKLKKMLQDYLIEAFYSVPIGCVKYYLGNDYGSLLEKALGVSYL